MTSTDAVRRVAAWADRGVGLAEILTRQADAMPDAVAYTLAGSSAAVPLSYGELARRAGAFAAGLRDRGAAGRPVALLLPTSVEWLVAFFAIQLAGGIAVPVSAPGSARALGRLASVLADARVVASVTSVRDAERLRALGDAATLSALGALLHPDAADASPYAPAPQPTAPDSTAIYQYTSGSTSSPKGVIVSQRNFLVNAALIARVLEIDAEDASVSWLPLFHDMGLMTGVILPLLAGRPSVLMPPAGFLVRPHAWLQAMTRHRATMSAAPNFAFDLCVDRITDAQMADIDLRRWRVAVCGAEPVRARTLDRFAERFAVAGFSRAAFAPSYGLAEATLFVSGGPVARGPLCRRFDLRDGPGGPAAHPVDAEAPGRTLVSCGRVHAEVDVVVVGADGAARAAGEVGEIWISGASVAHGYVSAAATAPVFGQRLPGDARRFCRTGDLGFVADGELYITGRVKDLIIVRGVNHYPQDIEASCRDSHPAIAAQTCAAYLRPAPDEGLVVVQEVPPVGPETRADIVKAMLRAVFEGHGVSVAAIHLARPGAIPRTTSGKIQRAATRAAIESGELRPLACWPPRDA